MPISPEHDDMVLRAQRARNFIAGQLGGAEYLPDSVIQHFDEDMGLLIGEITRLRQALAALNAAAYEQEEPSKELLDASGEADEVLGTTRPQGETGGAL